MGSPLDRRKFFGSAAGLSLSAASYANVAGANDRIGVAFLGCGGRAQAHIDLVDRLAGANDRIGVSFLGGGGRAQAHIDLVTRLAAEGKPVAPIAVCDVWDGLED